LCGFKRADSLCIWLDAGRTVFPAKPARLGDLACGPIQPPQSVSRRPTVGIHLEDAFVHGTRHVPILGQPRQTQPRILVPLIDGQRCLKAASCPLAVAAAQRDSAQVQQSAQLGILAPGDRRSIVLLRGHHSELSVG
jgi:hypothetical protein